MNCADARELLPLCAYDDLPADRRASLDRHLAGCPICHRELAELREVRSLLDATPAPLIQVDVAEVHRCAAADAARRVRRWRRLAVAGLAAAAALLLVVWSGLECRVEGHQFVLRWGAPPPAPEPPPPAPIVQAKPTLPPEAEARLRLLSELVNALAADAAQRDASQRAEVAALQARLDRLRQQDLARWATLERDVRALYNAHFPNRKGGDM
jgi:hypothetical protein